MDIPSTKARSSILVLGATGGTGRLIVSHAVARGHHVTALVRSAEKASGLTGARLVTGDARDEAPFREVTLLSTAARALVAAMRAERVSRLIAITGIGAGDSAGHGGFLFDRVIFPLLLRHVYADKDRQEAIIRDSGLDWVLVRPAVLNDKPGRGAVRALEDLSGFQGGSIAREDVARFVVDQVEAGTWLHRSPLIAW
jgi:uncharacterized protein YbjT (DUF2867 family)